MENENNQLVQKESWWRTALFYPFRLIASFMSAFAMGDDGLSLKKVLAAYSVWKAAKFTEAHLAPNNVIILVAMWLIFAGILIGIYSIGDISNALKNMKSSGDPPTNNDPK